MISQGRVSVESAAELLPESGAGLVGIEIITSLDQSVVPQFNNRNPALS